MNDPGEPRRPDIDSVRAKLDRILVAAADDAEATIIRAEAEVENRRGSEATELIHHRRLVEAVSLTVEDASAQAIEALTRAGERLSAARNEETIELPDWPEPSSGWTELRFSQGIDRSEIDNHGND